MLRCERLEPRALPAPVLLASAGGVVYESTPDGYVQRVRAFEADVPATLAVVGDSVFVGAGVGGGPRVVEYDRGWREMSSVFVGDPASRSGVSVLGYDRPSLDWRSGIPAVQVHVDRIPPLPGVDLSGITVRALSRDQWDANPNYGGYFRPGFPGYGEITLRDTAPAAVVHELGHAVDWVVDGKFAETEREREDFADAFHRWALYGEPNPVFDALAL